MDISRKVVRGCLMCLIVLPYLSFVAGIRVNTCEGGSL